MGAFVERISWTERVFIPTGADSLPVLERILKSKPLVDLIGKAGAKDSAQGDNSDDDLMGNVADRAYSLSTMADEVPESEWLSVGVLAQKVEELLEPFKTTILVTVLDRADDMGAVEHVGVVAQGVLRDGKIHLFRNGLVDIDAVTRTLWHEMLHFGLRRFLTEEQYIQKMGQLYLSDEWVRNKANVWIAGTEGDQMRSEGRTANYIRARGVDEALAGLAEIMQTQPTGYNNNTLLAKARRAVSSWVAKLADAFGFAAAAQEWHSYAAQDDTRNLIANTFAKLRDNVEPDTRSTRWEHCDPAFSQSAMKDIDANIRRGTAAMNQALLNKTTVHRAMFRNGLGWVDFEWGDSKKGIAHILQQRMSKDGIRNRRQYIS